MCAYTALETHKRRGRQCLHGNPSPRTTGRARRLFNRLHVADVLGGFGLRGRARLRAPRCEARVRARDRRAARHRRERADLGNQPGARHRHEARHRARVRRTERRRRHPRPQLALDFRDDAYQPNLAETNARALVDAQRSTGDAPRCPSTTTPMIAGNAPVSTTALAARPERGARDARQRRHADDAARRADRGRDRHAVLRRVHRRDHGAARHDVRRLQQVHLQRARELRPGGARDDGAVQEEGRHATTRA